MGRRQWTNTWRTLDYLFFLLSKSPSDRILFHLNYISHASFTFISYDIVTFEDVACLANRCKGIILLSKALMLLSFMSFLFRGLLFITQSSPSPYLMSADSPTEACAKDDSDQLVQDRGKPNSSLLHQYRHIVALTGEPLEHIKILEQVTELNDKTRPIYNPAHRRPHSRRENKVKQDLHDDRVIGLTVSLWNNRIPLVLKPDGSLAMGLRMLWQLFFPDSWMLFLKVW